MQLIFTSPFYSSLKVRMGKYVFVHASASGVCLLMWFSLCKLGFHLTLGIGGGGGNMTEYYYPLYWVLKVRFFWCQCSVFACMDSDHATM